MAGLGRRTFAPGEVLTATNVMGYLQDQAVMTFAGTAARGSAIGTAVSEGMVSYRKDADVIEVYNGSAWANGLPIGAWTSYTPTFTNFTAGNGTTTAKYMQIGKTMFVKFTFITGSTTTFAGTPVVSLPKNMVNGSYNAGVASITNGSGVYPLVPNAGSTSQVELYGVLTTGTYAIYVGFVGGISTAAGAVIEFFMTYEVS